MTRAAPAALLLASLALTGCFRELDGRVLLGSQGYTPRKYLLFRKWARQLTYNEPWSYKPIEYAVPAVNDSGRRLYAGSRDGYLTCWNIKLGRQLWRLRLGVPIRSEIIYRDGTLYFGAGGSLYAVDAEEHKIRWKYETKGEVLSAPVVTDDRTYFVSTDHTVIALDTDSGEWRWHYRRPVPESFGIRSAYGPLIHAGSIYVGFADGYLVSLKAQDGALQWEKRLSKEPRFSDVNTTPILAGEAVIAASFKEGLFSLDPDDGLIRWRLPLKGASTPAVAGNEAYVTTPEGEVVAFSIKTGKARWRARLGPSYLSRPRVYRDYLLISQSRIGLAQTRGGVWVLDRRTGEVDTLVDVGHGVRGVPLASGRNLFFLSDGGWLYAYRFGRGSR